MTPRAPRVDGLSAIPLKRTMKQRITYIVQNPDEFSPEQLDVRGDLFAVKDVEAAKEHRTTLGLDELPDEVCCSTTPMSRRQVVSFASC